MARSQHFRSKASTEAQRRFKSLLPVLLSHVAVHGVAHVKLVREIREDGATTVLVLDDTANRLPRRGHRIDPARIDHALLKEARRV